MNNINELKKLSFEKALELLEETVTKMEDGNMPLDEMITCFEKGKILRDLCSKKLNELEKKIEVLVDENAPTPEWEEFDVDNPREVSNTPTSSPQLNTADDDTEGDFLF